VVTVQFVLSDVQVRLDPALFERRPPRPPDGSAPPVERLTLEIERAPVDFGRLAGKVENVRLCYADGLVEGGHGILWPTQTARGWRVHVAPVGTWGAVRPAP
jgi:hypothetical protein